MNGKSLSIFFPCFNDSGTIASLIASSDIVAGELTDDYEIIIVDDGSRDNSRELLLELKKKYPRLVLVFHKTNLGYGAALRSGFSKATKDFIFYTDGDGQYDIFDLRKLFRVMQDGIDVVNGYKIGRNDPWNRVVIGILYLRIMRLLFNFHIRDVDCDFRLLRRRVFEQIKLHHSSGVICLELVKKLERAGYRFAEFPVHHYHRTCGRSQFFNFARLFMTFTNIIRLWYELMILRDTPVRVAYPQENSVNCGLSNIGKT